MPTQLASDDFQRAYEKPLSGGGNWIALANTGHLEIYTDKQVHTTVTVNNAAAFWNPAVLQFPDAAHYSEITLGSEVLRTRDIGKGIGPLVEGVDNGDGRLDGLNFKVIRYWSSSTGYLWRYQLEYINDNVPQVLLTADNIPAPVAGDIMRTEITGQILSGYYNGALALRTGVGVNFVGGQPGICITGYPDYIPNVASWRAGSLP